jgi:hypothetical protein
VHLRIIWIDKKYKRQMCSLGILNGRGDGGRNEGSLSVKKKTFQKKTRKVARIRNKKKRQMCSLGILNGG